MPFEMKNTQRLETDGRIAWSPFSENCVVIGLQNPFT